MRYFTSLEDVMAHREEYRELVAQLHEKPEGAGIDPHGPHAEMLRRVDAMLAEIAMAERGYIPSRIPVTGARPPRPRIEDHLATPAEFRQPIGTWRP